MIHQERIEIATEGRGFSDITAPLQRIVQGSGVHRGLCVAFVQHTSASLVIQENADPAVLRDLARWMAKVAPEGPQWEHDDEGPDDMPAHARAAITKTSETFIVEAGRIALGTWQAVYLWEHRTRPHRRQILVHVVGENT